MKLKFNNLCWALPLFLVCQSCSKENPPTANSRQVKYEITGTYKGSLTVVYLLEAGGLTSEEVITLPWTKEVTYLSAVAGIAIGGESVVAKLGGANQTATLKIYSAGNVVLMGSASTNAQGVINLPTLPYVFP